MSETRTFQVRIVQQFYPPPPVRGQPPQPAKAPEHKATISLTWQRTVDGRAKAAKAETLRRYPDSVVSTSHSENDSVIASFRYLSRPT